VKYAKNRLKQDDFDVKTGFYRKKKNLRGNGGGILVIMSCPEIALQKKEQ
jgi:hypothetical protein